MTQEEYPSLVSQAFDDWQAAETDIRVFAKLALAWSERSYEQLWAEAGHAPYDPDLGVEHVDIFHDSVGGLWPDDFEWITRGTVIREAVTAFDVYLEKAAQEALDRYRVIDDAGRKCAMRLRKPKKWQTPAMDVLVGFHAKLGNDVETDRVKDIRDLRHILTHQLGEIRTEEQRERFADDHVIAHSKDREKFEDIWDRAYVGGRVQLRQERVIAVLDDLGAVIRTADPAIWAIACDKAPLPDPGMLKAEKLIEFVPV